MEQVNPQIDSQDNWITWMQANKVAQEPTYDHAATNRLIYTMGVKFRQEILRPVGPSPTRLPVNQSFSLAATHLFWTLPNRVRHFAARVTPQAIAHRSRRLDTSVSPLALWMFGYSFLVGREILLDFGVIKTADYAQDIGLVLDCWNQGTTAARADGHTDNSEGRLGESLSPQRNHSATVRGACSR